jgi:hypothetical protein
MMAYISLEYASDGPSPSQIDRAVQGLGLRRHGSYYFVESPSEAELHRILDRLHDALKGSGARYRVSLERPDRGRQEGQAREEALRWVDAGLVDESVLDLMERDVFEFRQEALRAMQASVDHVVSLRRREAQEDKDRRHREAVKEEISILLRSTGGRTFQEVLEAFDMDEVTLEQIMQEMIDEGAVTAHQQGHAVIYLQAGPMLRSLAR